MELVPIDIIRKWKLGSVSRFQLVSVKTDDFLIPAREFGFVVSETLHLV
jgi:hypothetical protein